MAVCVTGSFDAALSDPFSGGGWRAVSLDSYAVDLSGDYVPSSCLAVFSCLSAVDDRFIGGHFGFIDFPKSSPAFDNGAFQRRGGRTAFCPWLLGLDQL